MRASGDPANRPWIFDLTDVEIEAIFERARERFISPADLWEPPDPTLFRRLVFLRYAAQRLRDVN